MAIFFMVILIIALRFHKPKRSKVDLEVFSRELQKTSESIRIGIINQGEVVARMHGYWKTIHELHAHFDKEMKFIILGLLCMVSCVIVEESMTFRFIFSIPLYYWIRAFSLNVQKRFVMKQTLSLCDGCLKSQLNEY